MSEYVALLPVDTEANRARRAAEAVVDLPGEHSEMTAVVLHVVEPFQATDEGPMVETEDLYEGEELPESADAAIEILEDAGVNVETRRVEGDPSETILNVARELDVDSIVMSGRKRSPAGKVLFGSISQASRLSADRLVISVLAE
jgi:nucleotide-binding universal stress UspA family protein